MTAVIPFPAGHRRSRSVRPEDRYGEVVIFPGVRVERLEHAHAERLPVPVKRPSSQVKLQEDYGDI